MKFASMGVCSITFAVLLSCNILILALAPWGLVRVGKCEMLYNLSVFFYAVHRSSFYGFFVMRLDCLNSHGHISTFKINALKCCVVAYGSFLFAVPLFTNKNDDKHRLCQIVIKEIWIAFGFSADMIICIWSSYMFVLPIARFSTITEDKMVHQTLLKESACLTISLISTIVAFFMFLFCEGEEHIAGGFDCTVKTCCLLAIATPVKASNVKLLGTSARGLLCFDCLKKPQAIPRKLSQSFALSVLSPISRSPLSEEIEKLTEEISGLSDGTPTLYNAQNIIELATLRNLSDLNGSLTHCNGGTERKSRSTIIRVLYLHKEDEESCGSDKWCMVRDRAASPKTLPFLS